MRFFELRDLLDRPVSYFALGDDTAHGSLSWYAIQDHVQEFADTDAKVGLIETTEYAENDAFYREIISLDGQPAYFICASNKRW